MFFKIIFIIFIFEDNVTYHPSQYSMMIGELDAASGFLHKAVRLAHQMHNNDAIIYTYSLVCCFFLDFVLFFSPSPVYFFFPC